MELQQEHKTSLRELDSQLEKSNKQCKSLLESSKEKQERIDKLEDDLSERNALLSEANDALKTIEGDKVALN